MAKPKKKDPVTDLLGDAPVQITLTLPAKQASAVLLMLAGMAEEPEAAEPAEAPAVAPVAAPAPAPTYSVPVSAPVATPPQMPQVAPVPVAASWPAPVQAAVPAAQPQPYGNVTVFPAPQQPQPAYAVPYQPGYPPTTAPQYDVEQLARAAAPLADRGMQKELTDLLARYGVTALSELNPMYYPSVAGDLRALGAMI